MQIALGSPPYWPLACPCTPSSNAGLSSDFMPELIGSILTNTLDLALITAPQANDQVTAVALSREPLYAVLPESPAAGA
jgi:hypothetical protein